MDEGEAAATQRPTSTALLTPAPEVVCPPTPLDVSIGYELVTDTQGGVLVTVQTNLPDTAELMASFYADGGAYFAQDTADVVDGAAEFGPFSNDGVPLVGTYEFSITLPIARNQPEPVQRCIGSAGELLTGPLVSKEEITGDNVASLDVIITVG